MSKLLFVIALMFLCLGPGCNDTGKQKSQQVPVSETETKQIKDQFVRANQQLLKRESDAMDSYEKTHKLKFVHTATGIRYLVYKASESGDSVKAGMQITMAYNVSLLDGTPCYSSRQDGLKTFVVAQEDAESGIHKGVQFLKRGDKALLMIPSALAHGLLGDFKKIPPQMPIVYDLQIY